MIRANIYTVEKMPKSRERALQEGVEMLAGYMGETVSSRILQIKLKRDVIGRVNPAKIGYGKLDKMVELHLLAVPLGGDYANNAGVAYSGSGVCYVDPTYQSNKTLRTTAAHEGAHAFGFLRKDSPQRDIYKVNSAHCCSANCLMHRDCSDAMLDFGIDQLGEPFQKIAELIGIKDALPKSQGIQEDFCSPCKVELSNYGEQHVAELRTARIFADKVAITTR